MKWLLTFTLVLLTALTNADAAILVFSPTTGQYTTKPDLATANSAADVAGKTVVITSGYTVSVDTTLRVDCVWKIENGGLLTIASGKTLTIAGVVENLATAGAGNLAVNGSLSGVPSLLHTGTTSGLKYADATWFGVLADGTTDTHVQMARALAAVSTYGELHFPAGVYVGYLSVRRNNITISGAGSGVTTIRQPAGTKTNTLELGDTASGNSATAYTNISVQGLTIDGNRSATTIPTDDLTGWGMPCTKISNSRFSDIVAINCWNGGVGVFINSNYNTFDDIYTSNNLGQIAGEPGFDINSSKYNIIHHVSNADKYGLRVLDNCWGNHVTTSIYNPTTVGLVYNNQLVNESHNNIFNVTVEGGVTADAVQIGANCRNSTFNITTANIAGGALQLVKQSSATNNPTGNSITLNSRNSGKYSALVGGDGNTLNVTSTTDGLTGAAGTWYAIDVTGDKNIISALVNDGSSFQIRTANIEINATENIFPVLERNDSFTQVIDSGTRTKFNHIEGYGTDIASNAQLTIPWKGSVFTVTGTNGITSMTTSSKGRVITLIFAGILTVTDGSNLLLNGNLVTAAGTTLTLLHDGTNWIEKSRSVN